MTTTSRALVEKHVRKVRRRLVLQNFMQTALLAWAASLAAAALWFLGQSIFWKDCPFWLRWTVPSAMLGVGTLVALVRTWLNCPALVSACLALDERCGLDERLTTFLTLPADFFEKPAGQALALDVSAQIARLDTTGKFPLRLRWPTVLSPVFAAGLAVVAILFEPPIGLFRFATTAKAKPAVNAVDIQQQIDQLKKVTFTPKDPDLKSEKLKELEAAWEKLVNKALDPNNEEKIRERLGEMKAMEDNLRRRAEELGQKAQAKDIEDLLEKMAWDGEKKLQPGPAKDLEEALAKGDLQKARDILDKLAKDLKAGKLDADQLKKMAEQFDQLQQKMKKALDRDDVKKKLEEKLKKGEINKEQFDREMNNLKEQMPDLKEWRELADAIGECKNCMKDGDAAKAMEEVGKALDKIKNIELNEDELREIIDRLENLENAEANILQRLQGNGLDGNGPPGAERPIDPDDPNSKIINQKQDGVVNPKGQQRVIGFAKGGNFTKVAPQEIGGAFKQAAQDAPEAIDRQRIPQDAADLTRGFFNKLGGQGRRE